MDIDIDVDSRFKLKSVFPTAVKAAVIKNEELSPHPCGAYFQNVSIDQLSGLAPFSYDDGEKLGYTKIDFLNLTMLEQFSSRDQILKLLKIEPDWKLLRRESIVKNLFQIGNHFSLVDQLMPSSLSDLADILALIRPQKRFLIEQYIINKSSARILLYKDIGDGYSFKKAHAYSYAQVIVLQLNSMNVEFLL